MRAYYAKVFVSIVFEAQASGADDVTLARMTCVGTVVRHTGRPEKPVVTNLTVDAHCVVLQVISK